jgi:hypothetical protein
LRNFSKITLRQLFVSQLLNCSSRSSCIIQQKLVMITEVTDGYRLLKTLLIRAALRRRRRRRRRRHATGSYRVGVRLELPVNRWLRRRLRRRSRRETRINLSRSLPANAAAS